MARTMTFTHDGFAVDVDTQHPLVTRVLALPPERQFTEEQWVAEGVNFLTAYMQNHPEVTEAQALDAINAGATWLVLRRAA
jgi:hypothetical protein